MTFDAFFGFGFSDMFYSKESQSLNENQPKWRFLGGGGGGGGGAYPSHFAWHINLTLNAKIFLKEYPRNERKYIYIYMYILVICHQTITTCIDCQLSFCLVWTSCNTTALQILFNWWKGRVFAMIPNMYMYVGYQCLV